MLDKFMVSDCDGGLYDTTKQDWHKLPPLRPNFSKHHRHIKTTQDLKACIRKGEFTFPGCYRLAFLTECGNVLSFNYVKDNYYQVVWDMLHNCDKITHLINVDECEDEVRCDGTGELLNNKES